jgi:Bifunctional DNA primase/polymerase, N-terminal/FaeA-like protein
MNVTARRLQLIEAGYCPIPLFGKEPPVFGKNNRRKGLSGWQKLTEVTPAQIDMWARAWPDARNTGVLTRSMPTLDLDILNEEAVRAIEDHVREHYEDRGYILPRIGKAPKRAIPFRTEEPFKKIVVILHAANGGDEKIEFLGDGQQVACFGTHPDTKQLYRWHGGEPGKIKLEELPYIREEEARALVEEIVEILTRDFNYKRTPERPRKGNGQAEADGAAGPADWQYLFDNIREGRALHDSLRDLAAKLIASGMSAGAAVNQLRALMEGSTGPHDDRWRERYNEIPRLVESAGKFRGEATAEAPPENLTPSTIDETLAIFNDWLILPDPPISVYAMLGAVAANYLPGDPVWLGIVAPPSSAKTEILNSVSLLPKVVPVATLTVGALLSGTSRKDRDKGAKGGLLRQIGDFGIIALKDLGSILSMHTETRAEVLAALREIFDGAWTRHLGTDGGKTLHWAGKVGMVFGSTAALDSYHAVIGALGDRWLLTRMISPVARSQFRRALKHDGSTVAQMRKELANAIAHLFAGRHTETQSISEDEIEEIGDAITLAVRLRGSVQRDRSSREIEMILGAEGTARIGLCLVRLLAGLDSLGVDRATAMQVVLSVAHDSVPPQRRRAYEIVQKHSPVETADVAIDLGLPTTTARRVLEDLAAYGLIERQSQGQGKSDLWVKCTWDQDE